MSDEKEKMDIEDIKGVEDIDIDTAVSEETEEPVLEETKEKVSHQEEKKEENKDVLEEAVAESKIDEEEKPKKEKKKGKKGWLKVVIVVFVTALITAAAVLGVMYYLDKNQEESKIEEQPVETESEPEPELEVGESFTYISSEVGLNLRKEPNVKSEVLEIIPYGTKITILDEENGWIQTEYNGSTGWVSTDYTTDSDPLIYENKIYGFTLTFKPSWAGYKFVEANNEGSAAVVSYFVTLPTTDAKWKENAVPTGYASLFVMGLYTKSEWAKIETTDGPKPAKLGESDKYVYTYLPGQAHPTDLKTQYYEINDIIETFETL